MDEPHLSPASLSRALAAALVALSALALSSAAEAQQSPTSAAAASPTTGEFGGGIAVGQVSEDVFATLSLQFGMSLKVPKAPCYGFFPPPAEARPADDPCETDLRFGFQVPLRLRVWDRKPKDDGVIREQDWDEVSDYFKIFRFIEYGHKREPIYARLGELAGVVIGHGTAMNGYYNVIDVDHYAFGLNSVLNSRYGGVELMLDNVADPEVMGYRLYSYPAEIFAPTSFWTRWGVGTSLLLDVDAPLRFERLSPEEDPNIPLRVDDQRNLIPERAETTGVLGFDTELLLVQEEVIDFVPYFDLNFHLDGSQGLHLGTFTNVRPLDSFHLLTRVELRWLGDNYIPDYFSTLYEIERNTYFGFGGTGDPKLAVLKDLNQGQVLGAYGEATFNVFRFLSLTGAYEDYQGPRNAAILLRARVTDLGPIRLGAIYRRIGFNGLSDAFGLDNALLIGELRYQVSEFFYLGGQYSRLYRLKDDGTYDTVDDWNVGGGVSVAF